jgi:hypothetical protein
LQLLSIAPNPRFAAGHTRLLTRSAQQEHTDSTEGLDMNIDAWLRLLFLFPHLLLCAYALHLVLKTDLRVMRRRVSERTLMHVHRRIVWVLAGLWATGAGVVLIDLWPNLAQVADKPKLLAKLACVSALTANALVLRHFALPRLVARRELSALELRGLAATGAVSTASWLMAAFIGLARPMAAWTAGQALGAYAAVLCPRVLTRRQHAPVGTTAVEDAAETLEEIPAAART